MRIVAPQFLHQLSAPLISSSAPAGELGMTPVLPGFSGHVPDELEAVLKPAPAAGTLASSHINNSLLALGAVSRIKTNVLV